MRHVVIFLIMLATALGIQVENGATSVITYFVMRDQTAGTVDTGITIGNLEMYYIEDQAAISADVFSQAHGAVTDAWTSGECIHLGQGIYRVDWPDAAFDGGVGKRVQLILVDGDAGAFNETLEVELSPPSNAVLLEGGDPSDALDKANTDINLDHLLKNPVDTSLPNTVHDNSILGYQFAKANVTNYNRTEDSGEGRTDYGDVNWLTAMNVNVVSEDNIDFGAAKKTSLNAATTDLSAITGDKASYKATGFAVANDVTTAHSTTDAKIDTTDGLIGTAQADLDTITGVNGVIIGSGSSVNDTAWQELIELMFDFDATATYATANAGSLVKQIADNAASGGATAQQVWEYDVSAISNTDQAGGISIWLFNVMEGDSFIDTTQTPWQAVVNKKGTPGTEYLRKDLFDVDGGNITSVAVVIGKQTEP